MDVSQITEARVRDFLKLVRKRQAIDPADPLLTLHLYESDDVIDKHGELERLLKNYVIEQIYAIIKMSELSSHLGELEKYDEQQFHEVQPIPNKILKHYLCLYFYYFVHPPYSQTLLMERLDVSEGTIRNWTRNGRHALTHHLRSLEVEAQKDITHLENLQLRLEEKEQIPHRLIGAEPTIELIIQHLTDGEGPNVIWLWGMGGIGKTAIAWKIHDKIAIRERFQDIVWMSARHHYIDRKGEKKVAQHSLHSTNDMVRFLAKQIGSDFYNRSTEQIVAQLTHEFVEVPYLVIIDNLETMEDVASLMEYLPALSSGRTKFLITARQNIDTNLNATPIYVRELPFEKTVELYQTLLPDREVDSTAIQPLYNLTGGVPLMIHQIAGLLRIHPLEIVIQDLQQHMTKLQPGTSHEERLSLTLQFIYDKKWSILSKQARDSITAIAFLTESNQTTFAHIQRITPFNQTNVDLVIKELRGMTFLDITGPIDDPVYTIYPLARLFIQSHYVIEDGAPVPREPGQWKTDGLESIPHPEEIGAYALGQYRIAVVAHIQTPLRLRAMMSDIENVLRFCCQYESLQTSVFELIVVLEELPLHMGQFSKWETLFAFAQNHARIRGFGVEECQFALLQGRTKYLQGDTEGAIACFEQSSRLATKLEDARRYVQAYYSHIMLLVNEQRALEAKERFDYLEANRDHWLRWEGSEDHAVATYITLAKVVVNRYVGSMPSANMITILSDVIDNSPNDDENEFNAHLYGALLNNRGLTHWQAGNYDLAIQDFQIARGIYASVGEVVSEIRIMSHLALVHWSKGELSQAEQYNDTCISELEPYTEHNEELGLLCSIIGNQGLVYLTRRELNRADVFITRHQELARRTGFKREYTRATSNLALIFIYRREYEHAIQVLRQELETLKKDGQTQTIGVGNSQILLSQSYQMQGQIQEARSAALDGLAIAETRDNRVLRILAKRALTECISDQDEKRKRLHELLDLIDNDRPFDEAAIYLALAKLESQPEEKNRLWYKGKHVLERIGAIAWLQGYNVDNAPILPYML